MESLKELDVLATQLLQKMPEILEKGKEYGGDLFVRFVKFALISEIVSLVFGVLIFGGSSWCFYKITKFCYKKNEEDEDYFYDRAILTFIFIIILLFCVFTIIGGLIDIISIPQKILQIIYVPELYIINYFK